MKKQDVYIAIKVENESQPLQIKINNEWHYLKPVKQVYVLTEAELKIVFEKGFAEGMQEVENRFNNL